MQLKSLRLDTINLDRGLCFHDALVLTLSTHLHPQQQTSLWLPPTEQMGAKQEGADRHELDTGLEREKAEQTQPPVPRELLVLWRILTHSSFFSAGAEAELRSFTDTQSPP